MGQIPINAPKGGEQATLLAAQEFAAGYPGAEVKIIEHDPESGFPRVLELTVPQLADGELRVLWLQHSRL